MAQGELTLQLRRQGILRFYSTRQKCGYFRAPEWVLNHTLSDHIERIGRV